MTGALAKHIARQTASRHLDAFYAGELDKPAFRGSDKKPGPSMRGQADELAMPFDKRGLPLETTLPTLRKMFWEVREAGAFVIPADLSADVREMLARPVNSLIADGLLSEEAEEWRLTELGVTAIRLLEVAGHVDKIRNFVEPVLFPEGRPSRLALQARLDAVLDRAAELQGKLNEVETYATLCRGRNQAPW